jgi:hypothetical protein
MRRRSAMAVAAVAALGALTLTAVPAGAQKAHKTSAKAKAFTSWANQIRGELAPCEAGTIDVETALGEIISAGSSATESDLVTLGTAAKNGAPTCSITSNNGILNVNSTNPPSGYPTLKSITSDIQVWADSDDQQVIIDAGKVADSNGNSTSAVTSLISDSQTADGDASTINSEMKTAAHQAGVKGWKGLGLPTWGLQSKS